MNLIISINILINLRVYVLQIMNKSNMKPMKNKKSKIIKSLKLQKIKRKVKNIKNIMIMKLNSNELKKTSKITILCHNKSSINLTIFVRFIMIVSN